MRLRVGRPQPVTIAVLALAIVLGACGSSTAETTAPATSEASPTSAPPPTAAPATPATTAPRSTTAPAPVPTAAAPTDAPAPTVGPTVATPTTAAPDAGPTIVDISFRGPTSCPADPSTEEPEQVFVSWVTSGADEVYVAIDDPDTPLDVGMPLALSGSLDFPNPCPGPPFTRTYYVVAVKGDQRDVRSQTYTFG